MVCTNISCMLRGGYDILNHIEGRLGIKAGETTPDGAFTIVEEECLAACANAPMMICGDDYFLDLTPEKVDVVLDELRKRFREGQKCARRSIGRCSAWARAEKRADMSWQDAKGAERQDRHQELRRRRQPQARRLPAARRLRGAAPGADAAAGGPGRRGEEVEPARPRRRGLPDRDEVVVHPQGRQASSTWSSTPTSRSRGPARTASSWPSTRTCCSRGC